MQPTFHDSGQRCMEAFRQLVPASCCALYRIDEHLQAHDFQLQHMQAHMHQDYLLHYRQDDPLSPRNCLSSRQPVLALRNGMQQQPADRSRRYLEFLNRHAVVDVVELIATRSERPVLGLSLLRNHLLPPFASEELQRLHALQNLLELMADTLSPTVQDNPRLHALTPRERTLALHLRDGASNKQLARDLQISQATVKTHLINLFRKVGVRNRTELVASLFLGHPTA